MNIVRTALDEVLACTDDQLSDIVRELGKPGRKSFRAHLKHLIALNEQNERRWQTQNQPQGANHEI